tara:strand:- start:433 stop:723 length:291 start_codon:yes stop_codon:yes gene_type:complete
MSNTIFLKDLSYANLILALQNGEVELNHGYCQMGWLVLSDKEGIVAEFTPYHGDKTRGNFYGEHWNLVILIPKQSKKKTQLQLKSKLNEIAGGNWY